MNANPRRPSVWTDIEDESANPRTGQAMLNREAGSRADADTTEREREWRSRLDHLHYALQPIVNIHSGVSVGFECLLRGFDAIGFESAPAVFDAAHADGVLDSTTAVLHNRAVETFASFSFAGRARLFLNLDNRTVNGNGATFEQLRTSLAQHGLTPAAVCLEISERHQLRSRFAAAVKPDRGYKIAIDDFGTGFSGLQLLYEAEPDFIKIDRFFIADIGINTRKRLFVSHIVGIAHLLGTAVIAEGVETAEEFLVCRSVGCDLVQGYFVQRPSSDRSELRQEYAHVASASRGDRRRGTSDERLILEWMESTSPLVVDMEMSDVLERFRRNPPATFFPVVDCMGEPLGIVTETSLRSYSYSAYGRDLLRNPLLRRGLQQFVERRPVADVNMKAEKILELFSLDSNPQGMLVAENMRYIGFLSARSLLHIINEKHLATARDQNPLTRLPGNTLIYEYVSQALVDRDRSHVLVYLDFNDFKPFNDACGFRAGDRAILLFAELMQKMFLRQETFVGHIGGDDFFLGLRDVSPRDARAQVLRLTRRFAENIQSLYAPEDRERGFIEACDRDGLSRRYPLMTVSAAVLLVPPGPSQMPLDTLIASVAEMKTMAKESTDMLEMGVINPKGALELLDGDGSRSRRPADV